jgi:thiol-disulfide isomerase/thioredoxin
MKTLAVALTFALVLFGCNSRPRGLTPEQAVSSPKGPAPEFELVNVAGGKMKSADFKGKVTVVDFWATWCQPCIAEIPNFNKLHEERDGKGVQMLAITVESGSLEDIKPKVAEFKMKYPVLVGNDAVVEGFGGLIGFPTTFIVDKNWKIYKRYMGMSSNKKDQIAKDIDKLLAEESE